MNSGHNVKLFCGANHVSLYGSGRLLTIEILEALNNNTTYKHHVIFR